MYCKAYSFTGYCTVYWTSMITSSNRNIFRVIGPLWRGALMFSLIFAWTNGWANKWDAGDLRRHRTHYDVIVMDRSISDYTSSRKPRKSSKARDWMLQCTYHSENWETHQQQCCQDACQFSERLEDSNHRSSTLWNLWNLTTRRPCHI